MTTDHDLDSAPQALPFAQGLNRLQALTAGWRVQALDWLWLLLIRGWTILKRMGRFSLYVYRRFEQDSCLSTASSLTYTTLLSLVPLSTVGVLVFSSLPVYSDLRSRLRNIILENLVPEVGLSLADQVSAFTDRATTLTAIGVAGLLATAVMMLFTIESSFNSIWRARRSRPVVQRIVAFWAVLTLAPILFAAGISLSNAFFHYINTLPGFAGGLLIVTGILPILLQTAGVTILFLVMPNRRIRWNDAVAGGLVASLLLQAARALFETYISSADTYTTVYGALSVVPIFLLWVYIVWTILLIGAEIAAALPEWQAGYGDHPDPGQALRRSALPTALAILDAVMAGVAAQRLVRIETLMRSLPMPRLLTELTTDTLIDRAWLVETDEGLLVPARDLYAATLHELMQDLGLLPSVRFDDGTRHLPWVPQIETLLAEMDGSERMMLNQPVRRLLRERSRL